MKVSTKKKMALFIRYITRIGVGKGLFLYFKLHIAQWEKDVRIGFLKHSINLRKGTTDLATFDQIFITRIYNFSLKLTPEYIVDCGANVGMASIYFANKYPNAKIIAIEPEESNFKVLQENCRKYENIIVLQKAVTSFNGKVEVVDAGTGNYGFMVKELDSLTSQKNEGTIVDSITLQDLLKTYHWDRIDLLKIDIEGSEKDLFASNYEEWLPKTRAITVEIHDRFMPGASTAVMRAIVNYDFSIHGSHEGFFFERADN